MKKCVHSSIMLTIILACQLLVCTVRAGDWGRASSGVQMSIGLKNEAEEIKTNQPIRLSVRFRNVSTNETFRIYQANAIEFDPGYSWSVISPSGKDISPDMKKIPSSESGGFIPLPPNQTTELEFDLSHLCKFNEMGTYKIIGGKGIYSSNTQKSITVVSNPLNLIVSD